MIKAIFFDLQGVLTKHGRLFSNDLPKAWEPEVLAQETIQRYYTFRLKKKLDKKKFFHNVPKHKRLAFLKLSKTHAGASIAVKTLSKKYPLYVASNHVDYIFDKELNQTKLRKYFKKCFVSNKLGIPKQDIRFFKKIFKETKIKKGEAIFVDDTKTILKIAKKSGAITVWVNNKKQNPRNNISYKPDFEIENLKDLIKIVKSIK